MLGIREFNRKILNLKNTLKITDSMKMISSVKLQQHLRIKQLNSLFFKKNEELINNVIHSDYLENNLFFNNKNKIRSVIILLFSSNRGMCGRFNMNVIKEAFDLYQDRSRQSVKCCFYCAGYKGFSFCKKRNLCTAKSYSILKPEFIKAQFIADDLIYQYKSNKIQEIWLVYTQNKSSLSEEPFRERLLPLNIKCDSSNMNIEYLTEETDAEFAETAIRLYISSKIYYAMIESAISEHYSRLNAMDSASSNCKHMIENYTLLRNRARQSSITSELSEIISGKETMEN